MGRSKDRDGRDAAGVGPYATDPSQLVPFSMMDGWTVSDGEPDIRSWEVRTVSGRSLGKVRELMVDRKAGEVVAVDIDIVGTDRHAVVPLRVVQIDRASRSLLMDSADLDSGTTGSYADQPMGASSMGTTGQVRYSGGIQPNREEVVVDRPPVIERGSVPMTDREVMTDREIAADAPLVDRRQAERRRIDRMSTDI